MFKYLFIVFFAFASVTFSGCSTEESSQLPTVNRTEIEDEEQNNDEQNDGESGEENTDEEVDQSQNVVFNILPMGDSRVQGDRPEDESYRFELWKLLLDNEVDFDIVGTKVDNSEYPTYQGYTFDTDHEGTGGATTTSLLAELDEITNAVEADIVLLGIGGNDLNRGTSVASTIANINTIIDKLQEANENIIIVLEQIAPATSSYMTPERVALLSEFHEAIVVVAENQTNERSIVVPVNMFEGWKDDYLADTVHYNELGAKEIANRYFSVLQSLYTQ